MEKGCGLIRHRDVKECMNRMKLKVTSLLATAGMQNPRLTIRKSLASPVMCARISMHDNMHASFYDERSLVTAH